jgi:hypothetical protein
MISSSLSFRYLSKVFSSAMSCLWKASYDSSDIGSFARRNCSLSFPASSEKARNAFSKSQTNLARNVSSPFSTKLNLTSFSQFCGVLDETGQPLEEGPANLGTSIRCPYFPPITAGGRKHYDAVLCVLGLTGGSRGRCGLAALNGLHKVPWPLWEVGRKIV